MAAMPQAKALASLTGRAMDQLGPIVDRIVETLREQVPGYGVNEGLSDEDIRSVLTAYLMEVLEELEGGAGRGTTSAHEELMRRRANEGITLTNMLHSYRIGVSLLWEGLAEIAEGDPEAVAALVSATPSLFEVLDRYSNRANEIHHEIALSDARRVGQVRASLLDTVLSVDSSPNPTFWDAVALLGLPRTGNFVVVEVGMTTVEPVKLESPPDFETLVVARAAVETAWFRVGPRSQVGIVALTPGKHEDIGGTLRRALDRHQTCLGISGPFSYIADAAKARAQAGVAISATTSKRRFVQYNHDILAVLLASAPDAAVTLVAETFAGISGLSQERRMDLLHTVKVWLDNDQSVAVTAAAMFCHRNTVNYRLRRFQDLTGHSFSDNAWLSQVVLALDAEEQGRVKSE
jgi:PucR C-terminal helix-turn-helix domain